jgi:hypothetical protein
MEKPSGFNTRQTVCGAYIYICIYIYTPSVEELRLLVCDVVWLLSEPMFRRKIRLHHQSGNLNLTCPIWSTVSRTQRRPV